MVSPSCVPTRAAVARVIWTTMIVLAAAALAASPGLANSPPSTPIVNEPASDGQILSPADVHMQTAAFSDPDPGNTHLCSDWEIWTVSSVERVWSALCITGIEKFHLHLGDGSFEGSLAGQTQLLYDTDYRLRVRHRDSSGDAATEWSAYGERLFLTGSPTTIFPLRLQDVLGVPTPEWHDGASVPVILPAGAPQPSLRIESPAGALLLEVRGNDGLSNTLIEPSVLAGDVVVRVVIDAGDTGGPLTLPESQVTFMDSLGFDRTIYLPSLSLPAGAEAYFWVAADGSTYVGDVAQTMPHFSTLARGAPVPWVVRQPGFAVEIVATGFQLPVTIAFAPNAGNQPDDPFYYVAELYGSIKVVHRDGVVSDYATDLLNFDPLGQFPGAGEQGLVGLVVEPATGDLFASMLYDAAGPHYPKVVRFHSTDGGLTAATQTTILDMVGEVQGASHQVSNLTIGPDGKLYVHVGDGFDSAVAQDLTSFRGKILRLNLDGSAPPDNPLYDGPPITARDYVYAYGFRNPFGGAWSASDGFLYAVENGPSVDRFARIVAGRNYLWDGSDASMASFAIYNWIPATAPVNIAFVQPQTFGGSSFPAAKMGHAFVTESGPTYATGPVGNGKRVSEFVVDAAGTLMLGPIPLVEYGGTGKATAAALAAGPDGLYFSDLYKDQNYQSPIDGGANVLRIKFLGAADFTADALVGTAPLTVQFTDASTVPAATAWDWDFGDGGTSTLENPSHVFTQDGTYDVTLSVTGANGVRITRKPGYICVGEACLHGLRGEYFDDVGFTTPVLTRTDATIDFDWGAVSPDPLIASDTFSVRWSGLVTPLHSEVYTFYANSDDGVRLWVDNQLVIDRWVDQSQTEWSGTIALHAGLPVELRMEYYENGGGAVAQLFWQSNSTAKAIIPSSQLTPAGTTPPPPACGPTPAMGCRTPAVAGRAFVQLRDRTPDPRDTLVWKWRAGAATAIGDFGNPLATTSYRLCLYEGGSSLVLEAGIPASGSCNAAHPRPCWKAKTTGFDYVDKDTARDGIGRLVLRAGASGEAKITLQGRGTSLPMPSLPLATPLLVQLQQSDGTCWQATYSATLRNDALQVKARAD